MGHPVQPCPQQPPIFDRGTLPDEYEKSRLEGILNVGSVTQHPLAGAQNQRAMVRKQGRERCLIAAVDEPLE